MAPDYQVPLSYPNPSLGQMASELSEPPGSTNNLGEAMATTRSQPVTGARQVILIMSLLVGLLFSTLDTSIVSTSLVTIANDLGDFVNASWVVLSYLLTYMGFAICISKLSDIYGRRNMLVLSWVIFIGFSLGCANSKNMTELIICRAFQGIGASGLYSLTQIALVEIGPIHRPSLIGAMIGATLAVSFVLGPLLGGVISQLSDWRWIFNINIPFGLVTILLITNLWPQEKVAHMLSWEAFASIDFIGSATLLLSCGLLVFAVQQAGSQTFAWKSPPIIAAFIISGLSWCGFVLWEIFLDDKRYRSIEPIFPIRLLLRRVYLAGLLVTFLTGFPYISLTILFPERFQVVNGQNVLMAGVHILPLLGACAVGSFLGGAISSKRNNTSFTLIAASGLQLLGVGLMTLMPATNTGSTAQYGFQAIFGLGVGLSLSAATIMTNIMAGEQSERASAQGAVAQARVLGGCLGLSLCTVIFNIHVNRYLEKSLSPAQLDAIHRSPLSGLQFPVDQRDLVETVYAGAFSEEIKVMAVVCAAMIVVSLFTIERHPTPLERMNALSKELTPSRRGSESGTEMNDVASARLNV